VQFTRYFGAIRHRPDPATIKGEWIQRVIRSPEREYIQADGRVRRWAKIDENQGRYLRVVLLTGRQSTMHFSTGDTNHEGQVLRRYRHALH
jgi:hypothetical protein